MCCRRCQAGLCLLGLAIVVNARALQQWPPLEVNLGPPSEVGPPLEVDSPLDVVLLWLWREEETLEVYCDSMVEQVGRALVGW